MMRGPASSQQHSLFASAEGPVAGIDGAGAVILDPDRPIEGLADSKTLSAARREVLAGQICSNALAWSIGWADAREIDSLNILQATLLAMRRAILGLRVRPARVEAYIRVHKNVQVEFSNRVSTLG